MIMVNSNDDVLNYLFREPQIKPPRVIPCPDCLGDGKETCHNPDHGFIDVAGGEINRLGCPGCGHDDNHKVPSGGMCYSCTGKGEVTIEDAKHICIDLEIDFSNFVNYVCEPQEIAEILGGSHG